MSGTDAVTVSYKSPYNFSWVIPGKLACGGWPENQENMRFLMDQGITNLVTLSPEMRPAFEIIPETMNWTEIPITEFQAPTLEEINQFIDICKLAEFNGEIIYLHCRQGRGRTGVMAACYIMKFQQLPPERAMINLRIMRPGSIETYEQERAVIKYHDALRST